MAPRKKSLAFLIHIPLDTREKLEKIRKEMKLDCASDAIIVLVDRHCDEAEAKEP